MGNDVEKRIIDLIEEQEIINQEEIRQIIIREVFKEVRAGSLNFGKRNALIDEIFKNLCGFGPIEEFLKDESVTEIMINGHNHIFVEKEGKTQRTNLSFKSEKDLQKVVRKMIGTFNRSVNDHNPIVDGRLEDGSRINVVLNPIATEGSAVTIRKFSKSFVTKEDLIREESITEEGLNYIKDLILQKKNIVISGGTSTGKTTFLAVIADFIPKDERLITIEDSKELNLKYENIISLECRNKSSESMGEVTMRDLIKTSLRMRPDRIIVGEVRGREAYDMLNAMNTGHEGSITTGHSNSPLDMMYRLLTLVLMGGELKEEVCRQIIARNIDYIIQLKRERGKRFVESISKVNKDMTEFSLKEVYDHRRGLLCSNH